MTNTLSKGYSLSCSEGMKQEYCCTVIRISACYPVEGRPGMQRTMVNGNTLLISKYHKEGDMAVYVPSGSEMDSEFLSKNNLYGAGYHKLNYNAVEVNNLFANGKGREPILSCGPFDEDSTLGMEKVDGIYSYGCLLDTSVFVNSFPELKSLDWESKVDEDFDTVCGKLLIWKPGSRPEQDSHEHKKKDLLKGMYDRIIPGTAFPFDYESLPLTRNFFRIDPDSKLSITVLLHGKPVVFSNMVARWPVKLSKAKQLANAAACAVGHDKPYADCIEQRAVIMATRSQILNRYVNKKTLAVPIAHDEFEYVLKAFGKHVPERWTIYGEIVGYVPGTSQMIRDGYDYDVPVGKCRLVPYRITDSSIMMSYGPRELSIREIYEWTIRMMELDKDLARLLMPIPILYMGTLRERYPEIDINESWHDNVLAALKTDVELFGMNNGEPLCTNKVPRKGLCIRMDNDNCPRSFKLKCDKFLYEQQYGHGTCLSTRLLTEAEDYYVKVVCNSPMA